jgi:hypothetical protein
MVDFTGMGEEEIIRIRDNWAERMGRNLDYAERLMTIDGSGPDGLVLKWLYQLKRGAPFEEVKKAYIRDRENYLKDLYGI